MRPGLGTVLFALGIVTGLLLAALALGGEAWDDPPPTGSGDGSSRPSSPGDTPLFVTEQPVIYVPFVVTATATVRPTRPPTTTPRPTTPTATPRVCRPGTPEPGVRCLWPTVPARTATAQSCATMREADAGEWCVWD